MPGTMWCVRKLEATPGLRVTEAPIPIPAEEEVLVKVEAASLCGTDLHIHSWDEWSQHRIHPPLTLGQEFAGTVVALGKNVRHVAEAITFRRRAT